MKIFGTIYPFIETDEQSFKIGRHVANYEFFKTMLSEGTFDEFHIFCLSVNHFTITKERLLNDSIPKKQKEKVRLFLFNHLIERVSSTEYHVFHLGGWGYFFPGLVYLRNKYAKNKFPITGLIHSLNGIETNYHALKMMSAPLLPYDTIICSSRAGEQVVKNIFSHLGENFTPDKNSLSYTGNFSIIPLGISEAQRQFPDKKECRSHFSIPENAVVLLTLGRFSPQTKSDLYPLIKTFQKLQKAPIDTPIILLLAGGAHEKQIHIVKQMISECRLENSVTLITNFSNDKKQYLYGAADIYISLSDNLQETFGISVIEAMAAGLPVVVSDINGYSELVTHEMNGYKIPTLWTDQFELAQLADIMNFETMQLLLAQCMAVDTEALYTYLLKLITNDTLRTSIGEKGQKTAVGKYLWVDIIQRYEKLWDDLFEQSKSFSGSVSVKENPFCNNYLETFSHYPSSQLRHEQECAITQDGVEALKTGQIPASYADTGSLLDNNVILGILKYLSDKPCSVKELLSADQFINSDSELIFTLLWMAKYSLIHVTE